MAAAIGLTPVRLRALFEDWIAGAAPLQAWLDDSAWRPAPGTPDDRAATPYELVAGVYSRQIETAQLADTCRRRLRYVAGVMWLGSDLLARVDGATLEQVAGVTVSGATARIALREDVSRHDLERALEAILPEPAPLAPE
ncbi:MAG: hypothetical protein IT518_15175 [Burkholderiales bacterium]|nr:hypothetical protein [Burkholderiales bacterium]